MSPATKVTALLVLPWEFSLKCTSLRTLCSVMLLKCNSWPQKTPLHSAESFPPCFPSLDTCLALTAPCRANGRFWKFLTHSQECVVCRMMMSHTLRISSFCAIMVSYLCVSYNGCKLSFWDLSKNTDILMSCQNWLARIDRCLLKYLKSFWNDIIIFTKITQCTDIWCNVINVYLIQFVGAIHSLFVWSTLELFGWQIL